MKEKQSSMKRSGIVWLLGIIFGLGALLSGISAQSNNFLTLLLLLWGSGFMAALVLILSLLKRARVQTAQLTESLEQLRQNELNLKTALSVVQEDFKHLAQENGSLLNHIVQMDYTHRIDVTALSEGAIRAIAPLNQLLDRIEEQMEWHEGVFDAIPYPIHVIDNELRWKNLNQSLVSVMQMSEVIKDKECAIGMRCSASNASICNTEECGIRQLREKGLNSTSFEEFGYFFRMDVAPITNKKGEQIGYVEIGLDTTALERLNNYVKEGLYKFGHSLVQLAEGNLELDLSVTASDEFTEDMHTFFANEVASGLEIVKKNIENLINEVSLIILAIGQGELSVRADETKFNGAWKDLILGMNRIVEEIDGPITEVAEVMGEVALGNLRRRVQKDYNGRFDALKTSINFTVEHFNEVIVDIDEKLGNIAAGNMNIENAFDYDGDFINVSRALNTIIESLNEMIGEFKNSVESVYTGATQVSAGSQALSQGSTEQASAIEELTASVTEISDQTKQNAQNSNLAKKLSLEVMENAGKGNNRMNDLQGSMTEINASSRDISKIIKVIDDIAFQTNILALNAAVEAARAGSHGKGFAVVAEEVRTLAARSADAAKETTQLIEGTIHKVALGTKIASETAEALNEIIAGIEKVTDLISHIATASNEQATGISQINQGIEQVAQVVQMNSATAEESAAASEVLSSQAELLNQKINHFRLRAFH